jgi:hypothetical protein
MEKKVLCFLCSPFKKSASDKPGGGRLNQCWENDRTLLRNFPSAFKLGSIEGKD